MIQCPNCGGIVKFNIPLQQMQCESCSSQFHPRDFQFGNSAEEETEYDVTIYRCRNCGGEIISTDETAAGFCSYCGASTVLEGRLSREKRPQFIIPFKKTKAECVKAFEGRMKRALFAPGEYKHVGRAEGFRGIYMPYWLYDMSQTGSLHINSSTSHRSGDYVITDHYNLNGNLDSAYNGVSYDASSSFSDDISNEIAPFNVKDITGFTPSYLAGFYADTADVPVNVYEDTAVELAQECTYNYLKKSSSMAGEGFDESKESVKSQIDTKINVERSAMFPVWFMSYRNKNRIAYATVNGQTGKVSADIPVSIPKFFVCAAIIAAVLFAVLQMFLTLTPDILIIAIAIIATIGAIMYNSEMNKILAKENYEDDLGMQARMERKLQSRMQAQKGASFNNQTGDQTKFVVTDNDKRRAKKNKEKGGSGFVILILCVFALCFVGPFILAILSAILDTFGIDKVCGIVGLITLIITIPLAVSSNNKIKMMQGKQGIASTIWTAVGLAIVTIVSFVDPASDIIYYASAIIAMVCVAINLIDLMASYNYIAMRPLPQFEMYQGGDDRA